MSPLLCVPAPRFGVNLHKVSMESPLQWNHSYGTPCKLGSFWPFYSIPFGKLHLAKCWNYSISPIKKLSKVETYLNFAIGPNFVSNVIILNSEKIIYSTYYFTLLLLKTPLNKKTSLLIFSHVDNNLIKVYTRDCTESLWKSFGKMVIIIYFWYIFPVTASAEI